MREAVSVWNRLLVVHDFLIAIVHDFQVNLLASEKVSAAERERLHQGAAALVCQLVLAPSGAAIKVQERHLDKLSMTPLRLRIHRYGRRRRIEQIQIAAICVLRAPFEGL